MTRCLVQTRDKFKKQQKQQVIWLVIKSQIKLQKFPQNSSETVTKETEKIEHDKKKKNLKKDMYPQKKDRKLLMI